MKQTMLISLDQVIPGMELADDLLNFEKVIVLGAGTILTKNTILFAQKQVGNSQLNVIVNPTEKPGKMKSDAKNTLSTSGEFEIGVDKALSMILHYEEVAQIAEIIKKIHRDRMVNQDT
jgi:hypothetical protein